MTYTYFYLQIVSILRTVKAINTASNITTYSVVVFTSSYEPEGLWELQRLNEQLISILSTENDRVLSCGNDKSKLSQYARNDEVAHASKMQFLST